MVEKVDSSVVGSYTERIARDARFIDNWDRFINRIEGYISETDPVHIARVVFRDKVDVTFDVHFESKEQAAVAYTGICGKLSMAHYEVDCINDGYEVNCTRWVQGDILGQKCHAKITLSSI